MMDQQRVLDAGLPPRAGAWSAMGDDAQAGMYRLSLVAVLLFAAALRLLYFGGLVGADDVSVAQAALRWLEDGPQLPTGHYSARIGLVAPQAVVFGLFGVGEWQLALLPLLWSLGGIALAYAIGARLFGRPTGLVAALVLAVFPLDIGQATTFVPDMPLGTTMALAVWLAMLGTNRQHRWAWGLLAGLAWGFAYLIKVEAFFLGFAFLGLALQDRRAWPVVIPAGFVALAVVAVETLVYYSAMDVLFYRLQLIDGVQMAVREEYSGGQLWVFPKAWFVTVYEFGLHYYAMFAGLLAILWRRERRGILLMAWIVAFLLWLQFGFNPFSGTFSFKSHLLRYCAMISVPMAVVIAYFLWQVLPGRVRWAGLGVVVAAGLFFANFNQLNLERQAATKQAISAAVENGWFPLYLDRTSYFIAAYMLYDRPERAQIHMLQRHDFAEGETEIVPVEQIDGYVLLNRGFMLFANRRYFMTTLEAGDFERNAETVLTVDNPMPGLAYAQAQLLAALAAPLPVIGDKVGTTVSELLEPNDVIVLHHRPAAAE